MASATHTAEISFSLSNVHSRIKYRLQEILERAYTGLVEVDPDEHKDTSAVYLHELIGLLVLRGAKTITVEDNSVRAVWRCTRTNDISAVEVWSRVS